MLSWNELSCAEGTECSFLSNKIASIQVLLWISLGAVLHVPCGLLWRGNNCTIKLLGKEFGLTVQPEPGTTHTPPVVQWRILNVPAPLEILLKEFADLELAFKLMPNISLNQYRIKIKFLVSGWDVREVLQQLQHWPWAIDRNSKEKPSPTRNSGTAFFIA